LLGSREESVDGLALGFEEGINDGECVGCVVRDGGGVSVDGLVLKEGANEGLSVGKYDGINDAVGSCDGIFDGLSEGKVEGKSEG